MTDFRALCARMADELDHYRQLLMDDRRETHALAAEARAALEAQPEPQDVDSWPMPGDAEGLAEVFWGRYDQPEPQGPTDEEIDDWHGRCADLTRVGEADHYWAFDLRHDEVAEVVRAALARWGRPAIEPVPVSERLPGPEDCDGDGRCWWFSPPACGPHTIRPCWTFDSETLEGDTHWLPWHALPVPSANSNDKDWPESRPSAHLLCIK